MQAAARDGLPIVIVDAKGEAAPRLHWSGLSEDIVPVGQVHDVPAAEIADGLPLLVDALLRPPVGAAEGVGGRLHHQDEAVGLDRYFAERAPATNLQIGFPLLMAVFGVKRIARGDLRPKPPAVLAAEEMSHAPPVADAAPASARPGDLTGTYGWADFVGARLAQIFRSAFILNFVFAAFAVGCAAVSIVQHDWKPLLVWVEIALIATVLINTGLGWLLQWHRRWLEGRELAERLRVALLLWLLGLRMAGASGAEATWTGWYARAAARAQGLRHARLDEAGVAEAREAAAELLDGQCRYHAWRRGACTGWKRTSRSPGSSAWR